MWPRHARKAEKGQTQRTKRGQVVWVLLDY